MNSNASNAHGAVRRAVNQKSVARNWLKCFRPGLAAFWLTAVALLLGHCVEAQVLPNSPTTLWRSFPYRAHVVVDYITDQQTGSSEGDIVGTNWLPASYIAFNAGTTPTNGQLGFRIRVGKDSSPAGFKGVMHVGIDANANGTLDLFISVDNSGSADYIRIFRAGTGSNASPSTTSIDSQNPLFTYTNNPSNYDWSMVTTSLDPTVTNAPLSISLNIDGASGAGETDYFISYFVPFADVVSGLNAVGVPGITTNSRMRYIVASATQPNSLNQDLSGLFGGVNNPTNYLDLDILTPPIDPFGSPLPPTAVNDVASTAINVPVTIPALANDSSSEGYRLTITNAVTTNGAVSIVGGTNLLFTPALNYVGTSTVTYTIIDEVGATASAIVTVTVLPPAFANLAITKSGPSSAVGPGGNVVYTIRVTNSGPVTATNVIVTDLLPANVTVVAAVPDAHLDGTLLTWTNLGNVPANTTISVSVTVAAPLRGGITNGAFVTSITGDSNLFDNVAPPVTTSVSNVPPVAVDDSVSVSKNTTVTVPVLSNDTDANGDALTLSSVNASSGTASISDGTNVVFTPSIGFTGLVAVAYVVSDGFGGFANGTLTVMVTNRAPTAADDVTSTPEDTTLLFDPRTNDADADGDVLAITSASSTNLTVTILGGTNLVLVPPTNFNGTATVTYTVTDTSGATATASIIVNVTPVNDGPVANNQSVSTPEDTALVIVLTGSDVDGPATDITVLTQPANGTLSGSGANVTYTPGTNYVGSDSFTFVVSDGTLSATGTVSITVTPVNDRPVANNPSVSTPEDTALAIVLTGSDSDGPATNITVLTQPANGTLSGSGANVTYTPGTNYFGSDSFTFVVSDGTLIATGTVSITVTPVNDRPVANNQSVSTPEDTALAIVLTGSDIDGPATNIAVLTQPANGVLSGSGANVTYTPGTNYVGSDSVTFVVSDGTLIAIGTVSITVTPVNDAPVANNQSVSTPEDTAVAIVLTGSDIDGPATNIAVLTQPANGTLSGSGANVTYTPGTNYSGPDSFTFVVSDGTLSATGTVSITVTPVNDVPVANNQSVSTPEDTALVIVLAGSDVDGPATNVTVLTQPTNGALSGSGANVTYTPGTNYVGSDSFTFVVSDGMLSATGTVSITVTPVNDRPVANNQSVGTQEDTALAIMLTGSDIDGPATNITVFTQPVNGTLSGSGANVTYTPGTNYVGSDSFMFVVSDGALSATGTVSITVTPLNDAPVAVNDFTATPRNVTRNISPLVNDFDVDGDALTVTSVNATNGSATIFNGTNVVFTPASNFVGVATIGYAISDGHGGSASAVITVDVTLGTNVPPVANDDIASTPEDTAVLLTPLLNDLDFDADPLLITSVASTNGTFTVVGGTNVLFTPGTNFHGTAVVAYTISDGQGGGASATITVTVTPVNDGPVANNQSITTPEDTSTNVVLTATDGDNTNLVFTVLTGPANGTIQNFDTNSGTLTYVPNGNYSGPDTFTFVVSDGTLSATGTVSITVTPVNDVPVAFDQSLTIGNTMPLPITLTGADLDGPATNFTVVSTPVSGVLTGVAPSLSYMASNRFVGVVTLTFTVNDGALTSSVATVTITVTNSTPSSADVAVNKSGPANAIAGEDVTFTLTVTNAGVDTATNVVVVDALPTGLTLIAAIPATATVVSNEVSWPAFDLAPGGSSVFTVTARSLDGGAFTNIAFSTSSTPDGNPGNNDGSGTNSRVTTIVAPSADVVVSKAGPASVPAGSNFTYIITVTNLGPSAASNITVIDHLPVTLAYVGATSGGSVNGGNEVTWTIAHLTAGAVTNFAVTVTAPAGGSITNRASASSPVGDPDPDNNSITNGGGRVVTTVVAGPQFAFQAAPAVFNPQTGLFEQRVGVTNVGLGTVAATRLYVTSLSTNATMRNASGSVAGIPYVQFNAPLNPGAHVVFTLEFFVPNRRPITNTLAVEAVLPQAPGTNSGAGVEISRSFVDLRDANNTRFVVEFPSTPGRVYTIIYTDDLLTWKVATPSVTASGTRTQWYDDGPPKTESKPLINGVRYYRVIETR